jgi:hypothetical protein
MPTTNTADFIKQCDAFQKSYLDVVFALQDANRLLLDLANQMCATNTGAPVYDAWCVHVYANLLRHLSKAGMVTLTTDDGNNVTGNPTT